MDRTRVAVIGAALLLGAAVATVVMYSLGLSNRGLAGAYSSASQTPPMTFKGSWNEDTWYLPGDVVTSDRLAYVAILENALIPPSQAWVPLGEFGPVGPAGPQGPKGDKGDPAPPMAWTGAKAESQPFVIRKGFSGWGQAVCPSSSAFAVGGGWHQVIESGFTQATDVVETGVAATGKVPNQYEVQLRNVGQYDAKIKVVTMCFP